MVDGQCSKGIQKAYSDKTVSSLDGYPIHRRRKIVSENQNEGRFYDNCWVVPHNLYLCTKYNAHANVEICSSVKAMKFLYKYVYKGHDRMNVDVGVDGNQLNECDKEENVDEIKRFLDARYISALYAFL
jgi:hypothetical protein